MFPHSWSCNSLWASADTFNFFRRARHSRWRLSWTRDETNNTLLVRRKVVKIAEVFEKTVEIYCLLKGVFVWRSVVCISLPLIQYYGDSFQQYFYIDYFVACSFHNVVCSCFTLPVAHLYHCMNYIHIHCPFLWFYPFINIVLRNTTFTILMTISAL